MSYPRVAYAEASYWVRCHRNCNCRTMTDIYADPMVTRNCHTIEVDSDSARFTLSIENIPSEDPKTGKNVALSVNAMLRKMHAPLTVGT